MAGYAANQMRKAVLMAEFMHEMDFSMRSAWDADDSTKRLVSAVAAVRADVKAQPIVKDGELDVSKVRMPSAESWSLACTHLQHMYDSDRKDCFEGLYAVEPR